MKQWLRRLTEQGRTVFITSHVLETVERLCDRVAIITRRGNWCAGRYHGAGERRDHPA
jgi:ABC-type multidrug transport system ATPase subunit